MKLAFLATCAVATSLFAPAVHAAAPAATSSVSATPPPVAPSPAAAASPASPPPSATPPPAAQPPAAAPCCHVTAGTVVNIELIGEVSTKTVHPGDHFPIKLASDLVINGQVAIPAGVKGEGEVVDAARPGMAGKPAKLVLAARFLDFDGRRVPLRAFKLSSAGPDNSAAADMLSFTPYVGVFALAVTGGDVIYPIGVGADAKIAQDIDLPPTSAAVDPQAAAAARPPAPSTTAPAPTPVAAAAPQTSSQMGTKP